MPSPWRLLALCILAVVLSLALLLWLTYRLIPAEMMPWYWAEMIIQGQAPARLVQGWFGNNPPELVRGLAVTWQRARPLDWWWLPGLVLLLPWLLRRLGRRRRRPGN
jgi:hypothetical protein